jgi:hypothetical protein
MALLWAADEAKIVNARCESYGCFVFAKLVTSPTQLELHEIETKSDATFKFAGENSPLTSQSGYHNNMDLAAIIIIGLMPRTRFCYTPTNRSQCATYKCV